MKCFTKTVAFYLDPFHFCGLILHKNVLLLINLFCQRVFHLFACVVHVKRANLEDVVFIWIVSLNRMFLLHTALNRKNQYFKHFICYHQKSRWMDFLSKSHLLFNVTDKTAAGYEQEKKQTKREVKEQQLHKISLCFLFTGVTQCVGILWPWNPAYTKIFSYVWAIK